MELLMTSAVYSAKIPQTHGGYFNYMYKLAKHKLPIFLG